MFGLFKSEPLNDATFGELRRRGRYWIGSIALPPHAPMELRLVGDRKAPEALALSLARDLTSRYASLTNQIEAALYEHYVPYAEANTNGKPIDGEELPPTINNASEVWPYVYPSYVLVEPMQGVPTIEVAYRVGWDEEHTVGARIQHGQLLELCGSV